MSQLDRGSASRIMYIEDKSAGLTGPARIGRVNFSKTGRTIYYRVEAFRASGGAGSKRITSRSKRARNFGFPDQGEMVAIVSTAAAHQSRSTTMSAMSTGQRSVASPSAAARTLPERIAA